MSPADMKASIVGEGLSKAARDLDVFALALPKPGTVRV
jgi:hypothetical protein